MKFFNEESNTKQSKSLKSKTVDFVNAKVDSFNSMLGTIWTVSSSDIAGITESVITPGIRSIKFVIGIMQVYKKLNHNYLTLKNRITKIANIINGFNSSKKNHIRESVIKRKCNVK